MKILLNIKTLILISIVGCTANLFSQDGTIDSSFGTDGWVFASIGEKRSGASNVAVQNDGKIVVVGTYNNGNDDDFIVTRYHQDGTLDSSFGTEGVTTIPVGITFDIAISVAIQENGNIVIGGYVIGTDSNDFGLTRVNSDGKIDSTFGTNGRVITPIGDQQDYLSDIKIQSDGKIIAIGYPGGGDINKYDAMIVRYNSNGELDNSFGTGGIVVQDFNGGADSFNDLTIQRDGKIVVVGYTNNKVSLRKEIFVVRYNSDGSLDGNFGENGISTSQAPLTAGVFSPALGYAVATQDDDKIIVAGESYPKIVILRYNTDGTLDQTFGSDGYVITAGKDSLDQATVRNILVQNNGQFIITGHSYLGGKIMATALRYNTNGSLDKSFGDDGFALVSTTGGYYNGASSTMQQDGKVLIAGRDMVAGVGRIGLVRINNSGSPISSIELNDNIIVRDFKLFQNYPNPFNPTTVIPFNIVTKGTYKLAIYNVLGQKVKTLIDSELSSGAYKVNMDGSNLPSGTYFYSISGNNTRITKKMILIK